MVDRQWALSALEETAHAVSIGHRRMSRLLAAITVALRSGVTNPEIAAVLGEHGFVWNADSRRVTLPEAETGSHEPEES